MEQSVKPTRAFARTATLKLALVVIALLAGIGPSISEPRCQPRTGLWPLFQKQRYGGMFHITLEPTENHNPARVQRHLMFATLWGRLLGTQLPAQTRGLCDAFIYPNPFPDLRGTVIIHSPAMDIDDEKVICSRALRDIATNWHPSLDAVRLSARKELQLIHSLRESAPTHSLFNASFIVRSVLPLIYQNGTLLHSLVAIDPNKYQSLDADDFIAWLRRQRSIARYGLISISQCQPQTDTERAAEGDLIHRLRNLSAIAPPGRIGLPSAPNSPSAKSPLWRLVIIGNADEPSNMHINSPAMIKYCERRHSFILDDASTPPRTKVARISCTRDTVNDLDTWIALYCDPQDCSSKQEQDTIAMAIARDPDVLAHAQGSLLADQTRGPYVVEIDAPEK